MMKTLISIILIQLCLSGIVQAQNDLSKLSLTDVDLDMKSVKENNAVMKGKIINVDPEELVNMAISCALVQLTGEFQRNESVPIQDDGTFTVELPQAPVYQQLWFSLKNYAYTCLYLKDGIEITFDFSKLKNKNAYMLSEGVTFSGKDAELTSLMNQHILFSQKEIPHIREGIGTLNREEVSFPLQLDSLFQLVKESDDKFKKAYPSSYTYIIDNERESAYYEKQLLYHLNKVLPDEILSKIKNHPVYAISNDSRSYLRILSWYFNNQLSSRKQKTDAGLTTSELSSHFSPAYADLIKMQFESRDLPEQLNFYQGYLPFYHYEWSKTLVQQQISNLEEKIKKINDLATTSTVNEKDSLGDLIIDTPFDGQLYVNTQTTSEAVLKQIKAKFPNRLIILDFWATWCAPCIDQMPYSQKLHHEAKQKQLPIEFVYLCTSSSSLEDKWKNKVLELEQPGTHIYVDQKLINELMTLFNKSGFPSYVVIKPNGEFDTSTISRINGLSIDTLINML